MIDRLKVIGEIIGIGNRCLTINPSRGMWERAGGRQYLGRSEVEGRGGVDEGSPRCHSCESSLTVCLRGSEHEMVCFIDEEKVSVKCKR